LVFNTKSYISIVDVEIAAVDKAKIGKATGANGVYSEILNIDASVLFCIPCLIYLLIMVLFLAFAISVLSTLFLNHLAHIQEIMWHAHVEVLVKHLLYSL